MKKFKRVIPFFITFILVISIVAVAWVINTTHVRSIKIKSKDEGVVVNVRLTSESVSPSQEITVDTDFTELKPCVYENGAFYDSKGNNVSENADYVRQIEIMLQPEKKCNLYATKTVNGDLPVHIVALENEITTDTYLCQLGINGRIMTLCVYIDGEEYTESGTATVELELKGE